MSAAGESGDIELDLTAYVEPADLDAAWALVLADARREEAEPTDDDGERDGDITAVESEADPSAMPSPDPDLSTLNAHQRESWASEDGIGRAEQRRRLSLVDAWDRQHEPAGRRTAAADWLANTVTPQAWDDSRPADPPTVCRIDGTVGALFAAGRVSRAFGLSGSGKSWIAKLGTLEVLSAGGAVLYLDGDGVWQDFRDHLKAMGLSRDDALSGRLHYSRVEGSLLGDDFRNLLDSQPWGLVVLDGFNVALTASGFKGVEDDGVTTFFTQVLNPAAATGAAVVVVDHMKKDGESDHGSVFKRNNLTGTDYAIKRLSLIAPGIRGYSSITLSPKDRPGWATSLHAQRGRAQDVAFAHAVVDSTGDSGIPTVVNIQLDPPIDVMLANTMTQASNDADTLRALLKANPAGFSSTSKVREGLKAMKKDMDNNRINAAAAILTANGQATRTKNGQAFDLRPAQPPQGGGQP